MLHRTCPENQVQVKQSVKMPGNTWALIHVSHDSGHQGTIRGANPLTGLVSNQGNAERNIKRFAKERLQTMGPQQNESFHLKQGTKNPNFECVILKNLQIVPVIKFV